MERRGDGRMRGAVPVRAAVILVVVLPALVLGWHLHASGRAKEAAREFLERRLPGLRNLDVELEPVTNVVSVRFRRQEVRSSGDPLSALGQVLSSALGGALSSAFEPALERELNLQAREDLDVYAMLLPYRARIVESPNDPK